jgi:hypothetical protein
VKKKINFLKKETKMTNSITKKQMNEFCGLNTPIPWNNFYLEINYSKSRVCRIAINGRKSPFFAGGYGYDKISCLLSDFLTFYTGKKIGGSCAGVEAVKDSLLIEYPNVTIDFVCQTINGDIYKVTNNN